MDRKFNWARTGFVFIVLLFSGCSAFGKSSLPYLIKAEMTMENSSVYEIAGLDFSFLNKSDKKVSSFTMVFCFFDEDGNPVGIGKSNQVITVESEVEGGELLEGCLSLDKYLYEFPESEYQIDFLYVSQIVYGDGEKWTDPFGFAAY